MSRPETEAGLGGRKSTGDEQKQNAMRGKVGREREDGVVSQPRDRGRRGMVGRLRRRSEAKES